jgi:hypothetical protein
MAKADKTPGAAAERLRADIDSGRTGDKVDFPIPPPRRLAPTRKPVA